MKDQEKSQEQLIEELEALRKRLSELQEVDTKYQETQKTLADERYLSRLLIDSFPDFIYVKDTQSRFIMANKAVAHLMGATSPKELIGKTDFDFYPREIATPYFEDEQHIIETQTPLINREEHNINQETGEEGWLLTTKIPYKDRSGAVAGIMGIGRNITLLKNAQDELARATEQAQSASEAKGSFLANMSHELRTPLNAIIGYSEILQEDAEDLGYTDLIPDLKRIWSAGKHLLALINDILDLSKIEAGKMELFLEMFEISPMLWDIQSVAKMLMEKNNNTLTVEERDNLGSMYADITKVRQVIFNLLSNASKFTENGTVTLTANRETMGDKDWIVFKVSDTGIGMTPDQMEKLFSDFIQADSSTTRKFGGTGLGLAISKRFCQLMGGNIEAQSTKGIGTTFTVRLPAEIRKVEAVVDETEIQTKVQEQAKALPPDALTVLVVDDDPVARDLLVRALSKEGDIRVLTAQDGKDGLQIAREQQPDIIILDVLMPGMDGWAVLAELKADPDTADIPVIIASMIQDKNLGYSLGASEFIAKPVNRAQLRSILHRFNPRGDKPPYALLVEDDDLARRVLKLALEMDGWETGEARNGREGLEQVEQRVPDVILLDMMMPEMNGFQFLTQLRMNPAWQSIPIIVVTAMSLDAGQMQQLQGAVTKVYQKSAYSVDDLVSDLVNRVRTYTKDLKSQEGQS